MLCRCWWCFMVGHLFPQNYDTIYVRFFATYTCHLSCSMGFFFPCMCVFSSHASVPRKHTPNKHAPICATNKHGIIAGGRIRGNELYRQQYTNSCMIELKSSEYLQFESSMATMAALISSKTCFLFIALTVVVVRSPTTDLLESVHCLLRDCESYFSNANKNMAENLIVRLQVTIDSVLGLLDSLERGEAGNSARILILESLVIQLRTLLTVSGNCSCIVHVYLPYQGTGKC